MSRTPKMSAENKLFVVVMLVFVVSVIFVGFLEEIPGKDTGYNHADRGQMDSLFNSVE